MSSGYDVNREVRDQVEEQTGLPIDIMLAAAWPPYRLRARVRCSDLNAADALTGTSLPALIIHSRDNDVIAPYMAEQFEVAIGENATLIWIDGPHSQAYLDNPEQYQQWLEEFLGLHKH
ncbi:hypothetical protein [Corynebacterium cystitidis]|uniref:hypothetical protein n=1 Tax=Corynebacterium cystitidis TaxID=35757 RepID=UPI00211F4079|nr:hypothetical protein [Corynebacterium cystitidis]